MADKLLFQKLVVSSGADGLSIQLNVTNLDGTPVVVPPVVVPPVVEPPVTPPDFQLYTLFGLQAQGFSVENPVVNTGEKVWFRFKVANTINDTVGVGILAARAETNIAAQSYTDYTFQRGETLEWRDFILLPTGEHKLYLGLGFDKNGCLSFTQPWYRLSDSVTVKVL